MKAGQNQISRRGFVKISAFAAVSAQWYPVFAGRGNIKVKSRIVRVHDPSATKPWDYSANTPWDHTVEPGETGHPGRIKERYFDYINEDVVAKMLDRGLRELTDSGSAAEAWHRLLPDLQITDRVTIKMNMNNASYDEQVTTNRMDQTMPLVNVIIDDLVDGLGLPEEHVTLLDAEGVYAGRPYYQSLPDEEPWLRHHRGHEKPFWLHPLILGTDPVALDSVMLDHIMEEIKVQGDNAPDWLKENARKHGFLQYAMDELGLGIHAHAPYDRIDYRVCSSKD